MSTKRARGRSRSTSLPPKSVYSTLLRLWIVAILALVFGVFLPGIAEKKLGVFSESDVRAVLEQRNPAVAQMLSKFDQQQQAQKDALLSVRTSLVSLAKDPSEFSRILPLIELERQLQAGIENARPPVRIEAFYPDHIRPLFPLMMACLGWLAFVFRPVDTRLRDYGLRLAMTYGGLLLFHRWPTWLRNLGVGSEDRVIYADANRDISVGGFWVQEAQTWLILFLLALVICQWLDFFEHRQQELTVPPGGMWEEATSVKLPQMLADTFVQWQIGSALLAGGFIYYAVFFWQLVAVWHDSRYIPAAIIVHVLWAVSWVIISRPFIITWYRWHLVRISALLSLARSPNEQSEIRHKILSGIDPAPFWNVTGTIIGVVGSFVFPMLQLLRK
jgi:hypothetical protein